MRMVIRPDYADPYKLPIVDFTSDVYFTESNKLQQSAAFIDLILFEFFFSVFI